MLVPREKPVRLDEPVGGFPSRYSSHQIAPVCRRDSRTARIACKNCCSRSGATAYVVVTNIDPASGSGLITRLGSGQGSDRSGLSLSVSNKGQRRKVVAP